jgi:hypothetical protein
LTRFRDPNLLIETIQAMQRKHDESLKEIQFKLTEMNQVKVHLKASNKFQPNLSLLNQTEATSLFGSIKMNACWSNVNSFKGQILKDEQEYFQLIDLCEFSPNDKWSLLYRGTRDGFGSHDFHTKCDNHSNTLTIFKAKESEFIFGGFTSVEWDSSVHTMEPEIFRVLGRVRVKPTRPEPDPETRKNRVTRSRPDPKTRNFRVTRLEPDPKTRYFRVS